MVVHRGLIGKVSCKVFHRGETPFIYYSGESEMESCISDSLSDSEPKIHSLTQLVAAVKDESEGYVNREKQRLMSAK